MTPGVPAFIEARRSIRAFRPDPVPRAELDRLVAAACLAPAPHHSRPWRWVVVDTPERKTALARGMGDRWRRDLRGDGVAPARADEPGERVPHKPDGRPGPRLRRATR